MRTKYITIRMTLEEALQYGLIICECGHPFNNHFGSAEGCARCGCTKYRPRARVGKFVKAKRKAKCLIPPASRANTSRTSLKSSKRPPSGKARASRSTGCSSKPTTGKSRISAKPSKVTTSKVTRARTSKHSWKAIGSLDYVHEVMMYECRNCKVHTSNPKEVDKRLPCKPRKKP